MPLQYSIIVLLDRKDDTETFEIVSLKTVLFGHGTQLFSCDFCSAYAACCNMNEQVSFLPPKRIAYIAQLQLANKS